MILESIPDLVSKGQFYLRDLETGLILCNDVSFTFYSDDRMLFPNAVEAQIEINNWNFLIKQNKPDTADTGGHSYDAFAGR